MGLHLTWEMPKTWTEGIQIKPDNFWKRCTQSNKQSKNMKKPTQFLNQSGQLSTTIRLEI